MGCCSSALGLTALFSIPLRDFLKTKNDSHRPSLVGRSVGGWLVGVVGCLVAGKKQTSVLLADLRETVPTTSQAKQQGASRRGLGNRGREKPLRQLAW